MVFPQGTQATLVLADGTTRPVDSLSVRATEYTVGKNGPAAMPAVLPPSSAYTYAVELSADEALAAGARDVRFEKPVYHYVENFLEFPVGIDVPTGYYDDEKGAWIPADNGRIIKLLSVQEGLAMLDVAGDGQPAAAEALEQLAVTEEERRQLATLYQPGQCLWRVPIPHFSVWDCNWGFSPPGDAEDPDGDAEGDGDPRPCYETGSIIDIHNQALGESVAVSGTPFRLHYHSDRVPGRTASRALKIRLTGATPPASLERVELEVLVAGRRFHEDNLPVAPDSFHEFVWDGQDAYGQVVQGGQPATVRIGYVYKGVYEDVPRFGYGGRGIPITGSQTRQEVALWREYRTTIGGWDARAAGIGGWTLDVHHAYDPLARVLYLGDGQRRGMDRGGSGAPQPFNLAIATVAGGGTGNDIGDGGPAVAARLDDPAMQPGAGMARSRMPSVPTYGVASAPDGTLYLADENHRIRRIAPDGTIATVAGGGRNDAAKGGPAIEAGFDILAGLALAPDGTLYVSEMFKHRVLKVAPDGTIGVAAGTSDRGFQGDDGPANAALLYHPSGLACGPDGSLYIADQENHRIRRVWPDGTITTFAGSGKQGYAGDGGPATAAELYWPTGLALGPDGSLYFSDQGNYVVRRIAPNGTITTVAGTKQDDYKGGFAGDGGPALAATLNDPTAVAFGPDGALYIADTRNHRIRRVGPDGTIATFAGTAVKNEGTGGFTGDGGPAAQAELSQPAGLAFGPNGALHVYECPWYIADETNRSVRSATIRPRLRRVAPPMAGFGADEIVIPADDGRAVYRFDGSGRHLETLEPLTKAIIRRFHYDEAGWLTGIEDGDGNTTKIERTPQGVAAAIVAPFGQKTLLKTDDGGFLAEIQDPAGSVDRFAYGDGGLLTSYADANGHTARFSYDRLGRLVRDEHPGGGFTALARTDAARGTTLGVSTKHQPAATYSVEYGPGGEEIRTNQCGCGTEIRVTTAPDDTRTIEYTDGSVLTRAQQPDARWGAAVPVLKSFTLATPGGRKLAIALDQEVALGDPGDPFSVRSAVETWTINGREHRTEYDAASRAVVVRSPAGRERKVTLDERGRAVRAETAGLLPLRIAYDPKGRIAEIAAGEGAQARTVRIDYDDAGRAATVSDPLGRKFQFAYDPAGRLLEQILPGDRKVSFQYDPAGNPVAIVPPGRPAHAFAYDANHLTAAYSPPGTGNDDATLRFEYDANRRPVRVKHADGASVDFLFDEGGRLKSIADPAGSVAFAIDPATGRLESAAASDGNSLAYLYDGPLVTEARWEGAVNGRVARQYDDDLRLIELAVNDGPKTRFQYDADGLLTKAGDLTLERDSANGMLRGTKLGNVTTAHGYDGFGEIEEFRAAFQGKDLLALRYERDLLGRIVKVTETIADETHAREYRYDAAGRLAEVLEDGRPTARYEYDANGNRLKSAAADGTETAATYDVQDRLVRHGAATFRYTASGHLAETANAGRKTSFEYDLRGNLRSVALADGTKVEYVLDPGGRRIGRKVGGKLVQGLLYLDRLRPVAELDGDGKLAGRFVYADSVNVPEYIERDGRKFRIIADHLGSPRLIVDAASGEVAQRIDYDAFGNVLADTQPGFQPFGFAGGLYDPQTGLVRFGHRDYDPATGRWTAKDPLGFAAGDTNLFVYVGNDPLNWYDPFGNDSNPLGPLPVQDSSIGNIATGTIIAGTGVAIGGAGGNIIGPAILHEIGGVVAGQYVAAGAGSGILAPTVPLHTATAFGFTSSIGVGFAAVGGVLIGTGLDQGITYWRGESMGESFADFDPSNLPDLPFLPNPFPPGGSMGEWWRCLWPGASGCSGCP
ncbi:MAG: RHS repeat-associated core domain-containing protein [Planctomycetales bacterium]